MTFGQQVMLEIIKAMTTALFVGVLGATIATSWSKRRDRRQEVFKLRTELLHDIARVGQGMYIFLQHSRRQLIMAKDEEAKVDVLSALDEKFLEFSTEAAQLQTLIGARFGVERSVASVRNHPSPAFLRWHQVNDLLALYYYNLKEHFPGIVLSETQRGYDGNYHSGLDLQKYQKGDPLDADNLRAMRRDIRTAYDEAIISLADAITVGPLRVE